MPRSARSFYYFRWWLLLLLLLPMILLTGVLDGAAVHAAGTREQPRDLRPANAQYAAGNYPGAAAAYERLVHAGAYSANLFYNLGNTYYRSGDHGRAILNYQRALLLDPGHQEARANLAFVVGRPGNGSGAAGDTSRSWLSRQWNIQETDLWPIVAAITGCLALALLLVPMPPAVPLAFLFSFRWRALFAVICFLMMVFAITMVCWQDDGPYNPGRAIVLQEHTRALYAPADNSKTITNLSVGNEVKVLSEQGAWDYAQLADGSRAWVAAAKLTKVIPAR